MAAITAADSRRDIRKRSNTVKFIRGYHQCPPRRSDSTVATPSMLLLRAILVAAAACAQHQAVRQTAEEAASSKPAEGAVILSSDGARLVDRGSERPPIVET